MKSSLLPLLLFAAWPACPAAIVPVPAPDLSRLESAVEEQIRMVRAQSETVFSRAELSAADRARAYKELGRLYHAYEVWDAAEACYRNASALVADDFDAIYLLASVLRNDGRVADASAVYRRCLVLRPGDTRVLVHLGDVELAQGRPGEAQALFEEALRLDMQCVPALAGLGSVAAARGDYRRSVESLQSALQMEPEATSLHYALGLAWRKLGDTEKARKHLSLKGSRKPALTDPLLDGVMSLRKGKRLLWFRGWLAMRARDPVSAAVAFREMIAMDPADPAGYQELGRAFFLQDRMKDALDQFREAVRLAPHNAQARYDLSVALARTGIHSEAVIHFLEALRLSPDLPQVHFHLANELLLERRIEEAREHYDKAAAAEPDNALARMMTGVVRARLRQFAEARARLESAAEAFPASADIAVALARLIACTTPRTPADAATALTMAQSALERQPKPNLSTVETLAMALAANGAYDKAVEVQAAMLAEVRSARRRDLAPLLETNLERYRQRHACAVPWQDGDPIFQPVPAELGAATSPAGAGSPSSSR